MKTTTTDRRSPGQRRWGMTTEFPIVDCDGVMVIGERRQSPDRRLDNTSLEQRMVMLAGMLQVEVE